MGDVTNISSNSAGFEQVIDYREFLHNLELDLAGQTSKLVLIGELNGIPQYEERVSDPDPATQIVNEAGRRYIISQLRLFFNKHTAMGDILMNRECAQLGSDTALSIFAHIEYNSSTYMVSEREKNQNVYFCGRILHGEPNFENIIKIEDFSKNAANPEEKFSQMEGVFDNVMRTLYLYLTSLKGGAMRGFGEKTTSQSSTSTMDSGQQQNGGLKLFNR